MLTLLGISIVPEKQNTFAGMSFKMYNSEYDLNACYLCIFSIIVT